MSLNKEKPIRTICGFCHTNCGLIAHVKDGVLTRVTGDPDHPVNGGDECPKGLAAARIAYSPDRLTQPLRKTKSGFKPVSWDEALDFIATRLLEIQEKYGGETIVRGGGAPVTEENRDGFSQIVSRLGSVNFVGAGHICHQPRSIGFRSVCGKMPQPDYPNTRLILIWGANPFASRRFGEVGAGFASAYGKFPKLIPSSDGSNAKLIVIDPWHNRLAQGADKWLRINPGTDIALALAMLHVIIRDNLYDREFVDNWTTGFDELRRHIEKHTSVWAENITGIKALDIEETARAYATTKPALIREGNAIDQYTNAVQTTRTIAMLEAITGNLDKKGGNVFMPFPWMTPAAQPPQVKRLSADSYPIYPSVPFPAFADALLTGKPYMPKAFLINHANTMLLNANSKKTREALERLDLIVVCDIFRTATTELADIILPEASPLERYGFRGYASHKGGFFALRRKVIEPIGETRTIFEIEYDLAARMGLAKNFPFKNNKEWITHRVSASNITFNDLNEHHIVYTTPPMEYNKYLEKGFKTPSGKIEFYSEKLAEQGYSPMPEYKDLDAWCSSPLSEQYPLVGTTRRAGNYTHTQFRNIPDLRKLDPDSFLRIHPDDAAQIGIGDGDMTIVESETGKINIQAKLTDETPRGVILIDFGWGNPGDGGADVNILTNDEDRDPISCSTSNHRFRCRIEKV